MRVPNVAPFVPRLEVDPVIVYHQDRFTKPAPFTPDIFVDITAVIDKKIEALSFHESQVFEWIPFVEGFLQDVPKKKPERLAWLKKLWGNPQNVNQFLPLLKEKVRTEAFQKILHIEAFERCEYGGKLTHDNVKTLFPFGIVNF